MGYLADDTDLLPVFTIAWIASVVRLILAVVREEAFGTELTLCLFAFLVLPMLAADGLRAAWRRGVE